MQTRWTLTFLGTGSTVGVPSFFCGCKACVEAQNDPRASRGCPGIIIRGTQNTLIDASPDLRLQLLREGITHIDQMLLTHEHFDHVGGLPHLEFFARLKSRKPLPVYAGTEAVSAVQQQFGFMSDVLELRRITPGEQLELDGACYTALSATHCPGAFGFLIELGDKKVAYFPDTGPLKPAVADCLKGIDVLIIDATFNGDNWMPYSHHSIDDAIALALRLGVEKCYLTHLAMHYDEPITVAELTRKLSAYNGAIEAAYDGLRLDFP